MRKYFHDLAKAVKKIHPDAKFLFKGLPGDCACPRPVIFVGKHIFLCVTRSGHHAFEGKFVFMDGNVPWYLKAPHGSPEAEATAFAIKELNKDGFAVSQWYRLPRSDKEARTRLERVRELDRRIEEVLPTARIKMKELAKKEAQAHAERQRVKSIKKVALDLFTAVEEFLNSPAGQGAEGSEIEKLRAVASRPATVKASQSGEKIHA